MLHGLFVVGTEIADIWIMMGVSMIPYVKKCFQRFLPKATLREYINLWLVRLGLRRVLPAVWINTVEVRECNETLLKFRGMLVRSGITSRLEAAERTLPTGFSIVIKSGWRGEAEQSALRSKAIHQGVPETQITRAVAGRSGHATGGAVDVILLKKGEEVDMGGKYLDFSRAGVGKFLTNEQKNNRKVLCKAMQKSGFVNYPLEWWHFSYGDKMWAAYSRNRYAFYGDINQDENHR